MAHTSYRAVLTSPLGTNLNGFHGFRDPRQGAVALVRAAVDPKEGVHGKVIDDQGTIEPW